MYSIKFSGLWDNDIRHIEKMAAILGSRVCAGGLIETDNEFPTVMAEYVISRLGHSGITYDISQFEKVK